MTLAKSFGFLHLKMHLSSTANSLVADNFELDTIVNFPHAMASIHEIPSSSISAG